MTIRKRNTRFTIYLFLSYILKHAVCVSVSVSVHRIYFKIVCDFWTSFYVNRQNWTQLFRIIIWMKRVFYLYIACKGKNSFMTGYWTKIHFINIAFNEYICLLYIKFIQIRERELLYETYRQFTCNCVLFEENGFGA